MDFLVAARMTPVNYKYASHKIRLYYIRIASLNRHIYTKTKDRNSVPYVVSVTIFEIGFLRNSDHQKNRKKWEEMEENFILIQQMCKMNINFFFTGHKIFDEWIQIFYIKLKILSSNKERKNEYKKNRYKTKSGIFLDQIHIALILCRSCPGEVGLNRSTCEVSSWHGVLWVSPPTSGANTPSWYEEPCSYSARKGKY